LEFEGNKYVNFPSRSIHARKFNINQLDMFYRMKFLPEYSTVLVDELGLVGDFTDPTSKHFKALFSGMAAYLPVIRHRHQRLFVSNPRLDGGV
jgi:hypothetical protein